MIPAVHLLRSDHAAHVGGDIAELHGTVEGLRHHGIDAVAATWDTAPPLVDIVHLYNLWLPRQLIADTDRARATWPQARVVITPIFWRFDVRETLLSRDPSVWVKAARREYRQRTTGRTVRRILTEADLVLPNTSAEANLIRRAFRTGDHMRAEVLANGIWTDEWTVAERAISRDAFLQANGLPGDTRTLIACVARIEPRKNQRGLIRAIADRPDTAVVFVGPDSDTRYARRARNQAARLLGRRAAWLGPLSPSGVRGVLEQADVHALPSFMEVASTVAMEAAAAGCEVVLTRTAATDEYWGDRVHGCQPHDSASIQSAIDRATASPRQPALSDYARRFDFDKIGERAARLYRSVLGLEPASSL